MDLQNKTVAVTGASGMLGPYLCRALLARGARVRGVVRNLDKARFLEPEGVQLVSADLMQREALVEAFRGCDAVVSNAALYRVFNLSWNANLRANKEGTENVYEAMASAGVGRAVHISTFGVYRWHLGKPVFTDDSPTIDGARRQGGAYRGTKQLSERLAFELSRKHGIRTTAVRPAGIYGARDHNLVPYFRTWLRLPVVVAPKFHFPFVYAVDVANAVAGALANDASGDKAYLTAGRSDTLYDFVKAFKEAANKRSLVLGLPVPAAIGIHVDCSKAQAELGFANHAYVDGLRETLAADAAYRASGMRW